MMMNYALGLGMMYAVYKLCDAVADRFGMRRVFWPILIACIVVWYLVLKGY